MKKKIPLTGVNLVPQSSPPLLSVAQRWRSSASMLQAGRDDMIIKYLNVNSQTSCKDQVISPSNYNVLKMSNIQLDLFFI
jgi:hypothetical protein